MEQKQMKESPYQTKIFTIPNILSVFRICLIPVIVYLYYAKKDSFLVGCVLIFSGITDVVDGYIARHYNMISDVGKVLDPIADKLTQASVLICLFLRYPMVIIPFAILVLKELFMGISGLLVVKRTGNVMGANWHGKAATCALHGMMLLHLFWPNIPHAVSVISINLSAGMVALSFALYAYRNIKALKQA